MKNGNGSHFHIHWSGKALDWERFETPAEAEKAARELMFPGETYTVEEHAESCPQCQSLMKKILVRDNNEASA